MKRLVVVLVAIVLMKAFGQSLIPGIEHGGTGRLLPSDSAVLDLRQARIDLPCSITPLKPELGLDFMFHTGYRVSLPLRELARPANALTIVFRVYPEKYAGEPTYFSQMIRVPAIEDSARGQVRLDGAFLVGEGRYRLDWLMRDSRERVCAVFLMLEARLGPKEASLAQTIAKDTVEPADEDPFKRATSTFKDQRRGALRMKVIANFAPQNLEHATLGPVDLEGLAAILRKIGSDPSIATYSIVACSIPTRQVFYRQRNSEQLDLTALGNALAKISPGKVDLKQLAVKNGDTEFLTSLLKSEMLNDRPDGLIFVSPKCPIENNVSSETIGQLKYKDCPVFYMAYTRDPFYFPWRDSFGRAIKKLRGFEYTVSSPGDLYHAWSDVVSKMTKSTRMLQASTPDF